MANIPRDILSQHQEELYARIGADIKTHGHSVMAVCRAAGEENVAPKGDFSFAYSIGCYTDLGFELLLCGMNPTHSVVIINSIAKHLRKTPGNVPLNVPLDGFANLPLMLRSADPEKTAEYVVGARAYFEQPLAHYNQGVMPVVQIVIPDREGKFPEDPHFDHAYMDPRQPVLYDVVH
jgi:hypothetical protein